jgi:hypothetical protein
MAALVGVRAEICMIEVPRLIFDVCAPIQASGVKQSAPYISGHQMVS